MHTDVRGWLQGILTLLLISSPFNTRDVRGWLQGILTLLLISSPFNGL